MKIKQDSWLFTSKIAHRGLHNQELMENSMEAIEHACEKGYAIELDIHILADNQIVVYHDDNLKRLTGSDKLIEECTMDEISRLRLGNTDQIIPTFDAVLERINGQVPLMIELKNKGRVGKLESETYKRLQAYPGEYVIQSFNPFSVAWFKKHAPDVIRGQLSGSYKDEDLHVLKKFFLRNLFINILSRPDFINYEVDYLDNPVLQILKKKVPVLAWTARDPQTYLKALEKCANVVFEGFEPENVRKEL